MSNSSIWPRERTLSGATTLGQSRLGNYGNKGILRIPQSSSITGASPSDCLVSYPRYSLMESFLFAEMQPMYSTAPADRASEFREVAMITPSSQSQTIFQIYSVTIMVWTDAYCMFAAETVVFLFFSIITIPFRAHFMLYRNDAVPGSIFDP